MDICCHALRVIRTGNSPYPLVFFFTAKTGII